MIFKRYDCVVLSDGRIGRVDRHFYRQGVRCYVVQLGASGPFEEHRGDRIREASVNEEKWLEGVRLEP